MIIGAELMLATLTPSHALGLALVTLLVLAGLVWALNQGRQPLSLDSTERPFPSESGFDKVTIDPFKQPLQSQIYRPIAPWLGRLILLEPERRVRGQDAVEIELYNAPPAHQPLIGKTVRLEWQPTPETKAYVEAVTRDVEFTQAAFQSLALGGVHPVRLDGLKAVGPLESLAGARPCDDMLVTLSEPVTVTAQGDALAITQEPIQVTGQFYTLVTVLGQTGADGDLFRVRHFNPATQRFDGREDCLRIPQVSPGRDGILQSTPNQLHQSPLNTTGWYMYGCFDQDNTFVVYALEPRALLRLQPNTVVLGRQAGLHYLRHDNWKSAVQNKGQGQSVLVAADSHSREEALNRWQEGNQAILMHLFGGIGGDKRDERGFMGLVTGHFAYGVATVKRDPFTGELRFDIDHHQVYAHNPHGIISGTLKWSSYIGDLRRGWLGTRPVSDVLIQIDALTQDYDFDGITISPLEEFKSQLQRLMALYRVGRGTGAAIVTPARSCVQDSNQALYATIQAIANKIRENATVVAWLQHNPEHVQTQRFQRLVSIGQELEEQLMPFGLVRRDWQQHAEDLVGVAPKQSKLCGLTRTLMSWRTMLPRRAYDELGSLFLRHGADLWFVRTNQIGGIDSTILPLEATTLLGFFSQKGGLN